MVPSHSPPQSSSISGSFRFLPAVWTTPGPSCRCPRRTTAGASSRRRPTGFDRSPMLVPRAHHPSRPRRSLGCERSRTGARDGVALLPATAGLRSRLPTVRLRCPGPVDPGHDPARHLDPGRARAAELRDRRAGQRSVRGRLGARHTAVGAADGPVRPGGRAAADLADQRRPAGHAHAGHDRWRPRPAPDRDSRGRRSELSRDQSGAAIRIPYRAAESAVSTRRLRPRRHCGGAGVRLRTAAAVGPAAAGQPAAAAAGQRRPPRRWRGGLLLHRRGSARERAGSPVPDRPRSRSGPTAALVRPWR